MTISRAFLGLTAVTIILAGLSYADSIRSGSLLTAADGAVIALTACATYTAYRIGHSVSYIGTMLRAFKP